MEHHTTTKSIKNVLLISQVIFHDEFYYGYLEHKKDGIKDLKGKAGNIMSILNPCLCQIELSNPSCFTVICK